MTAVESIERSADVEAPTAGPSLRDRLPLPPIILAGMILCVLLMSLAILRGVTL